MIDKVLDYVFGGLTGLFLDIIEWTDNHRPDRHDKYGG